MEVPTEPRPALTVQWLLRRAVRFGPFMMKPPQPAAVQKVLTALGLQMLSIEQRTHRTFIVDAVHRFRHQRCDC